MNRAPMILAGVWILTVLVSLPLALGVRDLLEQHLGSSLAAGSAASGVNYDWMQEFGDQATGVGTTFKPTIIGFGAVLDNLSGFLDDVTRPIVIVGAASAYIGLWLFLAGGIIDRYARDRATRAHGFFSACGLFFWRFVRLAAIEWLVYAAVFGWLHPWLFTRVFADMTRDTTVERNAFVIRLALYAVFGIVLAACNLIFDYAKVRAVVEDRHSAIGAVAAAARFVRRHSAAAVTLYLLDVLLFAIVVAVYAAIAPGAGRTGTSMWIGFAIGQLYIVGRLWVKLVFWASETALLQRTFAHAGYVARPEPAWPESPAAEALSSGQP